ETAATVDGAPRSPPDAERPGTGPVAAAGESVLDAAPPAAVRRSCGCVDPSPAGSIARLWYPSEVSEPWTIVETADVTAWVGPMPARPANTQSAATATPAYAKRLPRCRVMAAEGSFGIRHRASRRRCARVLRKRWTAT